MTKRHSVSQQINTRRTTTVPKESANMMESEKKVNNVALYTRVSSEEQATGGFSLDSQVDRLRAYCKAREWNIAGEYVDGGFTGRNTNRPGYQKMFAELGKWDALVVIKIDRIHRNSKNFLAMMETLAKQGKEFVSMSESFDTSNAMGRFVMNIFSLVAQLESEQIGERVTAAYVQKAKTDTAGAMNHRVPFGYRWDKDNRVYIEVTDELNKVKEIFKLYIDGLTMKQIGEKFEISRMSIRYYLHNTIYAGVERWCNFFRESHLKPIISINDFNKVQRLMLERAQRGYDLEPLQIQNGSFKLQRDKEKKIPVIQRGKHNWQNAW